MPAADEAKRMSIGDDAVGGALAVASRGAAASARALQVGLFGGPARLAAEFGAQGIGAAHEDGLDAGHVAHRGRKGHALHAGGLAAGVEPQQPFERVDRAVGVAAGALRVGHAAEHARQQMFVLQALCMRPIVVLVAAEAHAFEQRLAGQCGELHQLGEGQPRHAAGDERARRAAELDGVARHGALRDGHAAVPGFKQVVARVVLDLVEQAAQPAAAGDRVGIGPQQHGEVVTRHRTRFQRQERQQRIRALQRQPHRRAVVGERRQPEQLQSQRRSDGLVHAAHSSAAPAL